MSKLSGVFESFLDLDKIPVTDIVRWLKSIKDTNAIENAIANRIIYPQTIPVTKIDLEIDFAILKELLLRNPAIFYDSKNNRIVISEQYEQIFNPLSRLVTLICDVINLPAQVVNIYAARGNRLLGSVIAPKISGNFSEVLIELNNYSKILEVGKTYLLPIKEKQISVCLNKQLTLNLVGGDIGVIIKL